MSSKPRFVLFAHNATYDKLHQVATLGLTAAAMGKDVTVVLLFWTIKKLAEGRIDEVDFPPEYGAQADQVARLLREKKDLGEVVTALRANAAVGEPLRRAALRAVMRRGSE